MKSTKHIFVVLNTSRNCVKLYAWDPKRAPTYLNLISKNTQTLEILLTVPYTHDKWKFGNRYMQANMEQTTTKANPWYLRDAKLDYLLSSLKSETPTFLTSHIDKQKDPIIHAVINQISTAKNQEQELWESNNTWAKIFMARVYGHCLSENNVETLADFARQKQGLNVLQETLIYLKSNPTHTKTAAVRYATNKVLHFDYINQ